MDYVLLIFAYFAYLFVTISYAVKSYGYAKLPQHLRWEIYPIPHERREGGYLQELEWWKRPRRISWFSDIASHIKDYLFQSPYFTKRRGYWLQLYPFHLGMYCIFIFHIILGIEGFIHLGGVSMESLERGAFLYVPLVVGASAFILGSIGCIGILLRRVLDRDLRRYTTPKLYFNYCFFFIVFLSGLIDWIFFDPTLSEVKEFYVGFATASPVLPKLPTTIHIFLFLLFLIYLPYTRTMHYVTRFFTYFWIQWKDTPNLPGSTIEKRLLKQLGYRVTWSAPHIQSGKTWAEVATQIPWETK